METNLTLKLASLFAFIIISGCQTFDIQSYEPPTLNEIPLLEEYNIDLDSIEKPEPPNFELANIDESGNITIIPEDSHLIATHVIMKEEELKKIEALVDVSITYKEIITQQEEIINTHVDLVNMYIQRLQMERDLTRQYYFIWKEAQNSYERERRDHIWDNIISRTTMVVTVIGGIAVAAL